MNSANSLGIGGGYSGFGLLSSSFVANGFTPESSSSSLNTSLVVGIAVPVGVILIVVVVIVVVKMKKRTNSVKEVEKIDDVVLSPPANNMA